MIIRKFLFLALIFAVIFCGCNQKSPEQDSTSGEIKDTSVVTKEKQEGLTVDEILRQFKDGNKRFVEGKRINRNYIEQVRITGNEGQYPKAIVLSCIDSRAPIEIVCDKGIGEIFSTRTAGNYADEGIIGGMEFACKLSGAKVIFIIGHTECGAIKGCCDNLKLGNLTYVMNQISPAVNSVTGFEDNRTSENPDFVMAVTKKNVEMTINQIRSKSKILSELEKEGSILIVGGIYDVKTGEIKFL